LYGKPGQQVRRRTGRRYRGYRSGFPDLAVVFSYRWYVYPEAGTYAGQATIADSTKAQATLHVPADAKGRTIHVILEVPDQGEPVLTRYRRIVVTGF
jgi:hypothetical protein